MSHTIIGMFDELAAARAAEARLVQAGIAPADIDVSSGVSGVPTEQQDGKVKRFFSDLFGSERAADQYADVAATAEAIVTVHASSPEQAQRASDLLDDAGALDVDDHANRRGLADAAPDTIEVIQEDLQVGKRTVEAGGARLRSRIVEKEVSQDIRLNQEHVVVKRKPVDRVATAADLAAFREGQIEVVEHAEVPVVSKEVRVVEEVSLKKEQNERIETVRDTVRSTEVEVEEIDPKTRR